ncbi:MAG: NAD(P)/FAD-dependent oxidoreductase [Crocinitomicaceae bacterium]|nr:MAG: NAD(P)/FAD-dependent oxidoreductase [Crocinitomicaceae bacterium]
MVKTDVCIVGSGPSGAAVSLMLSKHKIHHVVIDKSEFPRDKTCGDGLILHTFDALQSVNPKLLESFLSHPKFISTAYAKFYTGRKQYIDVSFEYDKPFDPVFYGKRIDFDAFLVENCVSPYAQQMFGATVVDFEECEDTIRLKLSNGIDVSAKCVVGADGFHSFVSRKIAGNPIDFSRCSTFVSAYFKDVKPASRHHEAEIRMVYKDMPLFFYIFPLPNGQANVSLGGLTSEIQKYRIDLKKEVASLIEKGGFVNYRFEDAQQIGNWRGGNIPCNFGHLKVSGNRFLLVGDAAGLANAFYKEGVGTGMKSGLIAADLIVKALENDDFSEEFFSQYERALESEFGKLLKYSRLILKISKKRRIFNGFIFLFKPVIERKIRSIINKRTY